MKRVHILVEGQTEETFIKEVLKDHFMSLSIDLTPILVRTSSHGKGGLVSYQKVKTQIIRLCKQDKTAIVTTMFDFFRFPNDFSGLEKISGVKDIFEKVSNLEKLIDIDIGFSNFFSNIILHEFEALLFSDIDKFLFYYDKDVVLRLKSDRSHFESPEHINHGPETSPSKRINRACLDYQKVYHGALIAIDIGLPRLMSECKHFAKWIEKVKEKAN